MISLKASIQLHVDGYSRIAVVSSPISNEYPLLESHTIVIRPLDDPDFYNLLDLQSLNLGIGQSFSPV